MPPGPYSFLSRPIAQRGHIGKILNDTFRVDSFASTRFSAIVQCKKITLKAWIRYNVAKCKTGALHCLSLQDKKEEEVKEKMRRHRIHVLKKKTDIRMCRVVTAL